MSSFVGDRRLIYEGRKINLALQEVVTRDGATIEREVVLHPGAVAILAWVDRDHLCLLKSVRYAVGRTLVEVPAGTLDPGETPEQTALRELSEETGYRAGRIESLGAWWVSPGILDERMYLFACEDMTPGAPNLQPDERLEPIIVHRDEALAMVADGRIDDAKSMLAILLGVRPRPTS